METDNGFSPAILIVAYHWLIKHVQMCRKKTYLRKFTQRNTLNKIQLNMNKKRD